MCEILIQVFEVVVMAVIIVSARYIITWIKNKSSSESLTNAAVWAEKAVLYAQQVFTSSTGAEKKETVTELLKDILSANNVSITDEQLDILIEAAVKTMKISESAKVTISSTTTAGE